ncbi:hypothetical protein Taro_004048 [Colocasia esculenta]|uniref:Fe2OG dioxygenase domain-containing protein n=1 Tax=Colocasia esculenta TaxID=4460 RepID=A0A843TTN7_COLES|nr:hypothetical protein [Colocasia esculenta]
MVGRGDLGKDNATAAPPEMGSAPPLPSSGREAVAGLLYQYLSDGFCEDCSQALRARIARLASLGALDTVQMPDRSSGSRSPSSFYSARESPSCLALNGCSLSSPTDSSEASDSRFVIRHSHAHKYGSPATDREGGEHGDVFSAGAVPVDCDDLVDEDKMGGENRLAWQRRERVRFSQLRRKKDFRLMERVEGRMVNVLEGLELHAGVFNATEQKKIVDCVYKLEKLGDTKKLIGHTYSKPKKWMRGKGRVTIQFGCCYNYAVDKDGNPPGIMQDEEVDSLPTLFKMMIRRMVRWHILPPSCIPNSCIVNIYDEGDCIPPHIDHHDFLRPFCTVSFLSECNILFGSNLKVVGPGEFSGPTAIPLPVGSVLVLNGNGADVAKHCVPGVPSKRISITFRKMDDSRLPYKFLPDPDLQEIQPLPLSPVIYPEKHVSGWSQHHSSAEHHTMKQHGNKEIFSPQSKGAEKAYGGSFHLAHEHFPPLGGSSSTGRSTRLKRHT